MKTHVGFTHCPAKAITVGSPERAEWISKTLLKNSKVLAKNREYHSYVGSGPKGGEIMVISHGLGSAGAAVCFRESFKAGVKQIIRVGTAGGLFKTSQIGDIVVAQAAVRDEGTSTAMIPGIFPAVCDLKSTLKMFETIQETPSQRVFLGNVLTQDIFYPGLLDNKLEFYSRAHCLAVEMEISTLFVCASLDQAKAAACVVLDGNPLEWEKGNYDPRPERLQDSMQIAVNAALKTLDT
jgi:uridine phosphorylase